MNGLSLTAGCLCHALRRTSGRRCKKDICSFFLKEMDHCIDRRCFSGSRSSSHDQNSVPHCFHYSFSLSVIQCQFCLFFYHMDAMLQNRRCHIKIYIQIMQHLCNREFHIIIMGGINTKPFIRLFQNNFFLHGKIHHILFNVMNLYIKKLTGTI